MTKTADVLPFTAKPKTERRIYRKRNYTITFLPETSAWKWDVEIQRTIHFHGTAPSLKAAVRQAEKRIDKIEGEE